MVVKLTFLFILGVVILTLLYFLILFVYNHYFNSVRQDRLELEAATREMENEADRLERLLNKARNK